MGLMVLKVVQFLTFQAIYGRSWLMRFSVTLLCWVLASQLLRVEGLDTCWQHTRDQVQALGKMFWAPAADSTALELADHT